MFKIDPFYIYQIPFVKVYILFGLGSSQLHNLMNIY